MRNTAACSSRISKECRKESWELQPVALGFPKSAARKAGTTRGATFPPCPCHALASLLLFYLLVACASQESMAEHKTRGKISWMRRMSRIHVCGEAKQKAFSMAVAFMLAALAEPLKEARCVCVCATAQTVCQRRWTNLAGSQPSP